MKKKLSEKNKTHKAYQYEKTFSLGPWTTYSYLHDPIHLSFVLSRYKFVARTLTGKKDVLEVGCGDAIGIPIVAQFVKSVLAVDIDSKIIDDDKKRLAALKNVKFKVVDFCKEYLREKFDAVYSIDVLEHINPKDTSRFMKHITSSLSRQGVCIIGTPNITSSKYASYQSKAYHVNLHSAEMLRKLLSNYFSNVFIFSMNDEVVHTGFNQMAHYLWGIGVGKIHK